MNEKTLYQLLSDQTPVSDINPHGMGYSRHFVSSSVTDTNATKLSALKYDEDQPRDSHGRFASIMDAPLNASKVIGKDKKGRNIIDWTPDGIESSQEDRDAERAAKDAKTLAEAKAAVARMTAEEGFHGKISLLTKTKMGKLKNGERAARLGGYDPQTGEITIHPLDLDGPGRAMMFGTTGTIEGTLAHELNHARVWAAYRAKDRVFFDTIGTPAALEKLVESDGCTPYSEGIWQWAEEGRLDEKSRGQRRQMAAIETLAEWAGLKAMGVLDRKKKSNFFPNHEPMPKIWQDIHDKLHAASITKNGDFRAPKKGK